MVPMIGSLTAPGVAGAVFSVGSGLVFVTVVLAVAIVWGVRRTAEEFRRIAAREWELRVPRSTPSSGNRLAA
jgi:hypothetical protein